MDTLDKKFFSKKSLNAEKLEGPFCLARYWMLRRKKGTTSILQFLVPNLKSLSFNSYALDPIPPPKIAMAQLMKVQFGTLMFRRTL